MHYSYVHAIMRNKTVKLHRRISVVTVVRTAWPDEYVLIKLINQQTSHRYLMECHASDAVAMETTWRQLSSLLPITRPSPHSPRIPGGSRERRISGRIIWNRAIAAYNPCVSDPNNRHAKLYVSHVVGLPRHVLVGHSDILRYRLDSNAWTTCSDMYVNL